MKKTTLFIGISILTILLFFAIYFRVERLYGDAAYYLFQLVNDIRFVIEHNRPISYCVQFIPLILANNLAPINTLILWFSFNEWLFLFLCFLIMIYIFKDYKGALALLFTFIIGVRYNYFNQVSELIVAMPLVFMTFSILNRQLNWGHVILVIIFSGVLIFSHPLYTLIVFLLLVLVPLKHSLSLKNKFVVIFLLNLAIVVIKYLSLGQYESDSLGGSTNNTSIVEIFKHLMVYNYARLIFTLLPAFAGMFIFMVIIGIYRKKIENYFVLTFFWLFIIGYFSLVMYKFGHHFPNTFEPFERYLFLLPMIVSLVFFYYVYDHLNQRFAISLLSVVAIFQLSQTFVYGQKIKDRYRQFDRALTYATSSPHDKIAFRAENYYLRRYGGDWIMSNESLLLSAARSKAQTKQVIVYEAIYGDYINQLNEPDNFLYAPWWVKNISELNSDYFEMSPGNLHVANTDSAQVMLPDSAFNKISCQLMATDEISMKSGQVKYFEMLITNAGNRPLFSGMRADGVCYKIQWVDINTGEKWIAPFASPLLGDVYQLMLQEIAFEAPPKTGSYNCKIGLSFNDNRFIPLNINKDVIVNVK